VRERGWKVRGKSEVKKSADIAQKIRKKYGSGKCVESAGTWLESAWKVNGIIL